jgi:hypothetical protein
VRCIIAGQQPISTSAVGKIDDRLHHKYAA